MEILLFFLCYAVYSIDKSVSNKSCWCYWTVWFVADKGTFFPKWKEDTGYYVYRCSDRVKAWLKKVQMSGKKLFVLSSSYSDFASSSLRHILGLVFSLYVYVIFSALTLLNDRKGIRPVKNWVVRYWRGYLSGARCIWFAYCPAVATATLSSLALLKSRMVYLSDSGLTRLFWKKAIKLMYLCSVCDLCWFVAVPDVCFCETWPNPWICFRKQDG